MRKKQTVVKDSILINGAGKEVHLIDGANGPMIVQKIDHSVWLQTGEEYCPECHCLMMHRVGYWECDICKHSITDEESADGEGYPTLEATYEEDYEDHFDRQNFRGSKPESCGVCGGPWPHCVSTCTVD